MSKNKKLKISAAFMVVIALFIAVAIIIKCVFLGKNKTEEDDIGKVYYYQTELEHIACEDSGVMYADNEILVVADSSAKEKDIQKLAEKYNAEIVGCIEITGDYQWLLSDTYNRDELDSLVEELEDEECMESACLNFVSEVSVESSNVQYGAEWSGETWDDNEVAGSNWNIEAISAMGAWEYMDQMKPIKVGLIDGGFDAPNAAECCITPSGSIKGHDDLAFAATFYNDIGAITIADSSNKLINHGTHVAGTMAAISDNNEGICGVYPFGKGNLYGVSLSGSYSQYNVKNTCSIYSVIAEKCMYAELILRNVKIINYSYGTLDLIEIEVLNNRNLKVEVDNYAEILANYFERFLDLGYDFVLVPTSGNESNKNYIKLRVDSDGKPIYEDDNVISDVNGGIIQVKYLKKGEAYFDFKNELDPLPDRSPAGWYYQDSNKNYHAINGFAEEDVKTTGFLESKYNSYISAIDKEKHPDVYNRIIVVGAIGNHDVYTDDNDDKHFTTSSVSSFSNLGSRCDILAPREDVFSCISSSKYDYSQGTSMAAPHVSGVAAMVWAANNSLTGAEVKQIVCSAQNTNPLYNPLTKEASDLKWRVLDAEKAVKSAVNDLIPPYDENVGRIAIKLDNDKLNPSPENGGIIGYVVDSVDSTEKISGADITATDADDKEYTVQTDSEGHFELVLPQGVYTIKAAKADCIETVLPGTYTVKAEEVITLKENIKLESVENAFINTVIDNESVWKDSSSEMWFQDLNFDGQNELIVGKMFRYEVYTYVNNSLHKVEQQGNVNENWHPLYNMKLCYNAESGKYVGITRIGITMWVGMFETSYENDKLKFTEIVSMNEGDVAYGVQSTWYNGAGDEITESEYVELYNNYFKNLTEVAYTTDSIMMTDYDRLTRNEKFNRFKKSYEAFQIGEKIGGFEQISVSTPEKIIYSKENLKTYDDILSMYHHYISTQWKDYPDIYKGTQGMYGLTLNETSYLWYHYDKTNGLSNAGYQFMDINGDGTDELIVGRIDSNTGNGLLYDLYTIQDGIVKKSAVRKYPKSEIGRYQAAW